MLLMVMSGWAFSNVLTSASQSARGAAWVLGGSQSTVIVVLADGSRGFADAGAEAGADGGAEAGAEDAEAGAELAAVVDAGALDAAAEELVLAAELAADALVELGVPLPLLLLLEPQPASASMLAAVSSAAALVVFIERFLLVSVVDRPAPAPFDRQRLVRHKG